MEELMMEELFIRLSHSTNPWLRGLECSCQALSVGWLVELRWSETVEQVHHGNVGLIRNDLLHWGLCCSHVGVYVVFIYVECISRRALLLKSCLNTTPFFNFESLLVLLDLLISLPKHGEDQLYSLSLYTMCLLHKHGRQVRKLRNSGVLWSSMISSWY